MLKYQSIRELTEAAEAEHLKISELVLKEQAEAMEQPVEELYERMKESFAVMREAVRFGQKKDQRSMSGLTGGEGFAMKDYAERTNGGLCGSFMSRAISRALAVAGCNASMGRIVAAPTAGSCGILPGCLVSLYEDRNFDERDIIMSMFTAGAFGMVIARNASIAGAQGGCQAECGSAAGMAAASLVELMGGLDPALDYVTRSLQAGRHVVTANKLLLAHHYGELRKLALEQGVSLRFGDAVGIFAFTAGAAVADGIVAEVPILFRLETLTLFNELNQRFAAFHRFIVGLCDQWNGREQEAERQNEG